MPSITIKDVQGHSEGLKIEFDINLGVYFSDTDLNTDQFNLQVDIKLMGDSWFDISRRWEAKFDFDHSTGIPRISLPIGGGMSGTYCYAHFNLPDTLDSTLGIEQAHRVRAVAALIGFTLFNQGWLPKNSHYESLKSSDAQERDIHIHIPIMVDYIEPQEEHLDFRKYLDTIALENLRWHVQAVLASAETRADDFMVFCKEVPLVVDGQICLEEESE